MRLPEPKNIVIIHKTQQRQAEKWCREQLGQRWEAIGNRSGLWCCFWAGNKDHDKYRFYFQNEKDALVFGLKWAS
jgi:hypothetical protein